MSNNLTVLEGMIRRKIIKDGKPIRFKLYFSERKYYLNTFIWKTRVDMFAGAMLSESDYHACFIPIDKQEGNRCFGELHFYDAFVSHGVIAHELLHAIFDLAYKQDKKINPPAPFSPRTASNNQYCEFLCSEIERLTDQFWQKYPPA